MAALALSVLALLVATYVDIENRIILRKIKKLQEK